MLVLRPEEPRDADAVRTVVAAAFPTDAEPRLVDALRAAGRLTVSLVAEDGGRIVGYTAFSPVHAQGIDGGVGLAPVAVTPDRQRQGIGSQLIIEGLRLAREAGATYAVVLGEPGFYARFGFLTSSKLGLSDEYGGGDAFQAVVWGTPPSGLVKYAPEFAMFG